MATLQQRLNLLIAQLGADHKSQDTKIGTLASLSTTAKASLVASINEIVTALNAKTTINDSASSGTQTWSSNKIGTEISAAITALINGSDSANDTLKELADRITAAVTADAGAVSAISVQSFTAPQKTQARANIDAYGSVELGNPDTDLVALYNTAKA